MKRTLLLTSFLLAASLLHAQTVDEIVSKMTESVGGMNALNQVKARRLEIKVELPDGNELQIKTSNKRQQYYHQEQTLPNGMKVVKFCSPTIAMTTGMDGTLAELPPAEIKAMQVFEGDIDAPWVEYAKKGHSLKLVGTEKVDGRDNFRLDMKLSSGREMSYWVDKETYLLTRSSRTSNGPMGELVVVTTFKDYRVVNGIKISHEQSIDQGQMGILVAHVNKVEINPALPDALFQPAKN